MIVHLIIGLGPWCLTPLPTIFQSYCGYWILFILISFLKLLKNHIKLKQLQCTNSNLRINNSSLNRLIYESKNNDMSWILQKGLPNCIFYIHLYYTTIDKHGHAPYNNKVMNL